MKIVRLFLFLVITSVFSLASNCKKPRPVLPPTDLGFLPIDSICKQYWAFKKGSLWVYENKKGGKNGVTGWKDTIDCILFESKIMAFESKYWKLTTERNYFVHKQRNKDEYGNQPVWEYSINGPETGYGPEKPPTDWWSLYRYKWNPYGGEIGCFLFPYFKAAVGLERFISDTTINGIQCKDVIVMYVYPDHQMPNDFTHATEIYWAKDIGIVRYVSKSSTLWDIVIVDYKLIK